MKYLNQLIGLLPFAKSRKNSVRKSRADLSKVKRTLMSCTTVPQMTSALRYAELANATHLELYQQYKEFKHLIETP